MKYMLFNPLKGPPWEYPAIKKQDLILDIFNLKFISSYNITLKHTDEKFSNKIEANRGLEIKSHSDINDAYLISIYNLDGYDTIWNPNLEMHPKVMKVIRQSDKKIEMIGFGFDKLGNNYNDYGITILLQNKNVNTIILHNFEKERDTEYYKDSENLTSGESYFQIANSYLEKSDKKGGLLNMIKAAFLDNQNAQHWLFDKGGTEDSEIIF